MATEGGDDEISWSLNLDNEGFKKGIDEAKDALGELAEGAELPIGALKTMIGTTSFVVAAFAAMKAAISMVETAEEVTAVNAQFDLLSQKAGIAGDEIKNKLIKAAGGLAEDTEIIKAANQAIVSMGQSAARLPEIMELARKASALTGESLLSTFQNMSSAMENGNKKALKQYGIFVDTEKAVRNYAAAHGVAVNALSEAGKRQAMLNAAIDAGKTALANVNPNIRDTANTLESLKVTLRTIGEVISVAFEKLAGPTIRNFLTNLKGMADDAKSYLTAKFGTGTEQVEAQLESMNAKLLSLKDKMLRSEGVGGKLGFFEAMGFSKEETQAEIGTLEAQINELKKKRAEVDASRTPAEAGGGGAAAVQEDIVNKRVQEQNEQKFQNELLKMRDATLKATLGNITTLQQAEDIYNSERADKEKEYQLQRQQILQNENMTAIQHKQLLEQLEQEHIQKMKSMEQDLENYKIKAMEQELATAERVDKQMAASAALNGLKAQQSWQKSGQLGGAAMTAMEKHTTDAFTAIGEGAKSGSDIAKGFMFGMIGDVAQAQGQFMVADSFSTFPAVKVPELAMGGTLLALAGALHAQSGGSSSLSTSSGGGSVTGSADTGTSATVTPPANPGLQQPQKSFTLEVHGNVWGSADTSKEIVDMFRNAADATDYKYVQIGN